MPDVSVIKLLKKLVQLDYDAFLSEGLIKGKCIVERKASSPCVLTEKEPEEEDD